MMRSMSFSAGLQRHLIAGTLTLLASAALLFWSQAEHDDAAATLRLHGNRLAQARAMHQAARDADATARLGLRQLEALRGAGLLDAPDRQAWQRHLLGLHERLKLDKLEWELSPVRPATGTEPDTPATTSALRLASLHLQGEVAHEGRLLPLLERPAGLGGGLFLLRRCRLSRNEPAADAPALTVDCEIDGLFLQLPEAPAEAAGMDRPRQALQNPG